MENQNTNRKRSSLRNFFYLSLASTSLLMATNMYTLKKLSTVPPILAEYSLTIKELDRIKYDLEQKYNLRDLVLDHEDISISVQKVQDLGLREKSLETKLEEIKASHEFKNESRKNIILGSAYIGSLILAGLSGTSAFMLGLLCFTKIGDKKIENE